MKSIRCVNGQTGQVKFLSPEITKNTNLMNKMGFHVAEIPEKKEDESKKKYEPKTTK